MRTLALRGSVVTDHEILAEGTVLIEGATIRGVGRKRVEADEVVEMPGSFLVPGFVDLQVNGAFGVDVVSRPESLGELSDGLLATGTTSYLPTIVTLPLDEYPSLLSGIPLDANAGAEPLGLHLEGPFISQNKRGAHSEDAVAEPDPDALRGMLEVAPVKMVTLAPEVPGAQGLMDVAHERDAVVSLGHSEASFEEAYAALDAGAQSVTHLFNAMSPLHHREPGLPGAALAHPWAVCGLVVDGRHVHPEMVRLEYVYENLMVGVQARNSKLRERAERVVREVTGCGEQESRHALERSGNDVRLAVLLIDGAGSMEEARSRLQEARGSLRRARGSGG
ncbi:MAG: amidohydrolase family protein [Rubrobacter sp.]